MGTDSEAGKKFVAIVNRSFENIKKFISERIAGGEFRNENLFELQLYYRLFLFGIKPLFFLNDG